MAEIESSSLDALQSELLRSPRKFSFTKAAELLEKLADDTLVQSDVQRNSAVGFVNPPNKEVVRFRSVVSLGFPSADIDSAHQLSDDLIAIDVNFMGLYGPASPLPTYFTEAIIEEEVNQVERVYFLSSQTEVRDYRSQRINVTQLEERGVQTRKQIRAGTLAVVRLNERQMQALKSGDELVDLLNETELAQFTQRQLVVEVAEKAASHQRDFLDIFNHRLISLYYRATKKYQPYRDYESGGSDAFSDKVYALMGAPDAEQRAKSALQWPRLLHFIGLLAMKQASKERIVKVLSGYFNLPNVDVEEAVLRLVNIPDDQRCVLGKANSELGETFMLGSQVADRSGKFRVLLQQLDFDTFNDFLPASGAEDSQMGQHYLAINELLQFIKPSELLCDVQLELRGEEVPPFVLDENPLCRLGWSTWLGDTGGQDQQVIVG